MRVGEGGSVRTEGRERERWSPLLENTGTCGSREREREEEVKQCLIEQMFHFLTRDVLRMYGGKIIVAE